MTFEYMDEILDIRIQLHEDVTIIYVVDGFEATLNTQDGGRPSFTASGKTPMHALQKLVLMLESTPAVAGAGARGSLEQVRSDPPRFQRNIAPIVAQQWWPPGDPRHQPIAGVDPGQNSGFFLRKADYGVACAVKPGDWVVYEANGQMYAFSGVDFEKMYSPIGGDVKFEEYGPQRQRFDQRLAAWIGPGVVSPKERMEGIEHFYEMVNEDIDLGNVRRKTESQDYNEA